MTVFATAGIILLKYIPLGMGLAIGYNLINYPIHLVDAWWKKRCYLKRLASQPIPCTP